MAKSSSPFSLLRPNFLILDEPTNHLDVATVEALGKALSKFKVQYMYSVAEFAHLVHHISAI